MTSLPSGPEETDSGLDEMSHSESSPKMSSHIPELDHDTLANEDTEAGPDIAEDDFQSASEVFKDPNAFDFLSQHGQDSTNPAVLARQSLYVKFDPLIAGRPSLLQQNNHHNHSNSNSQTAAAAAGGDIQEEEEQQQQQQHTPADKKEETDLIGMQSPSPKKNVVPPQSTSSPQKASASASSTSSSVTSPIRPDSADPRQHLQFQVSLSLSCRSSRKMAKSSLYLAFPFRNNCCSRNPRSPSWKRSFRRISKPSTISGVSRPPERSPRNR